MFEAIADAHAESAAVRIRGHAARFEDVVARLRGDLVFLADSPEVDALLRGTGEGSETMLAVSNASLESELERVLAAHPELIAARLILRRSAAGANHPIEWLALERDTKAPAELRWTRTPTLAHEVMPDELWLRALAAKPGRVVLSEVRLARTRDGVRQPRVPELLGAIPLRSRESDPLAAPDVVLVLSLDLSRVFQSILADAGDLATHYVVGVTGDFLAHPDGDKAFGFEHGEPHRIQAEWPELATRFDGSPRSHRPAALVRSRSETGDRLLLQPAAFDPTHPERSIGVVAVVPSASLKHRIQPIALRFAAGLALSYAIVCGAAGALIWLRSSGFRQLARATAASLAPEPASGAALPIASSYEVGEIARGIATLRDRCAAYAQQLRESEIRLQGVVGTRSVGIVTIDATGIVQAANATVEEIFGHPVEQLVGRNVSALMPPRQAREHDGYLAHYFETGVSSVIGRGREVEGRHRDGAPIPLLLSVGRYEVRGATYFTGILREIGELKQKETALQEANARLHAQAELHSNLAVLARLAQDSSDLDELARRLLGELMRATSASAAAFHLVNPDHIETLATWAFDATRGPRRRFELRDGLVGQCVAQAERLHVRHCPADYFHIGSGLGDTAPLELLFLPIRWRDHVVGVLELASLGALDAENERYLERACEMLGSVIHSGVLRDTQKQLLLASQDQARVLKQKQDELSEVNRELEAQASALHTSREELRQSNRALAEQTRVLERERENLRRQNAELDAAQLDLQEKAAALETASRYKSEFLANMSHELRTPLNSSLILARLLADDADGNLSQRQVEMARTILTAGHELLRLIDDILDLAKVEAGKLSIELERVPVRELLDELAATFTPLARERELGFQIELEAEAPREIQTDRRRVLQILRNLIGNALRFCDDGPVRVVARCVAAPDLEARACGDASGGALALDVLDAGPGIPAERHERIFEPFEQLAGSHSQRTGGTGLGLSISRQLARLLGGEIRLQSAVGQGSCFTLYLPERGATTDTRTAATDARTRSARRSGPGEPARVGAIGPATTPAGSAGQTAGTAPTTAAARTTQALVGRRILLVDDDPRNVFALSEVLERHGARVVSAPDGAEALAKLDADAGIDLVLLDVMMPVMDGFEAIRRIRMHPTHRDLPVIALTAKVMKGDRERCMEEGVNAYLPKPVDLDALLDTLRAWLEPGGASSSRSDVESRRERRSQPGPE